jgi:hypothetical protein
MSQFAFLQAEFPDIFAHATRAENLANSDPRAAEGRLWTFPLQGKVKESQRHIFSSRLALPLRILALSSSDSGTVCIHSNAGGFMTNGQSTANRI